MTPTPSSPRFLSRGVVFVAVPVALTGIYTTQLVLAGNFKSWGRALWQETVYWSAWTLISVGIFWLCRWLHAGPRRWQRHALGLLAGAIAAMVLLPLIYHSVWFGTNWLAWKLELFATAPPAFYPALRRVAVNLIGPSVILYAGTVLAWHAATYYRDSKARQLQSAELESLLRQAQLQALRNQLNPHFLFNTLHSIAELVHENPPHAEQMLLRLAELLRKALRSSSEPEVALAEELDFVRGYLEIEQMRLGDRLRVTWDIAPEALSARVPSLLLQPLVENAIQHGIAPSVQTGTLLIRAWREGEFLHVQVRDNGPGLSAAPSDQRRDSGSGVGLANTRSRLQRLYGEHHRFELIDDHGLSVNVRFLFTPAPAPANAIHAT
ncbi:MAG TPA: sensor histidine kinase [Opitutaceae bacterium]|nr:sensor histidine kinase [Opitutaceae bacterium]